MRVLAIEASTSAASVALIIDGDVRQIDCAAALTSSETLLPAVQAILAEAGISLAACDGIAFGAGPGAFTGLRVVAAMTQGLAFVHELPVVGIETLAAIAWASGAPAVLAALDARMNEVYSAAYLRQDGAVPESSASPGSGLLRQGSIVVTPAAAIPLPDAHAQFSWAVCGNAVAAYPEFAARLAEQARFVVLPLALPQAAAVAELAALEFAAGRGLPAEQALPLYIRDKVALTVRERLALGGRA